MRTGGRRPTTTKIPNITRGRQKLFTFSMCFGGWGSEVPSQGFDINIINVKKARTLHNFFLY